MLPTDILLLSAGRRNWAAGEPSTITRFWIVKPNLHPLLPPASDVLGTIFFSWSLWVHLFGDIMNLLILNLFPLTGVGVIVDDEEGGGMNDALLLRICKDGREAAVCFSIVASETRLWGANDCLFWIIGGILFVSVMLARLLLCDGTAVLLLFMILCRGWRCCWSFNGGSGGLLNLNDVCGGFSRWRGSGSRRFDLVSTKQFSRSLNWSN